MSNYQKLSDGALADAYGALKAKAADVEAQMGALKAELERRQVNVVEGDLFRLSFSPSPRTLVDAKRLKAERPEIYRAYSYTSAGMRVTCTARKGTGVDAEPAEAGEGRKAA